jgi:hypothetical protein
MDTISKESLKQLRDDIDAALKAVGDKHGVALRAGNASYTATNATFKLEVSTSFNRFCTLYGFKPENLGATFQNRGVTFTLIGLDRKSRKYPVLARNAKDGKTYKFDTRRVLTALGLPVPLSDFGADVFGERA